MLKTDRIVFEYLESDPDYHRIYSFFLKADKRFVPSLSSRVDLIEYSKKLSMNAVNIFLSYEGNDVAECSVYCNRDIAFVSSICVIDAFSGKGYGSFLLEKAESTAKTRGCKAIELEAFYESGSVSWYLLHGYMEVHRSHDIGRLRKELA